MAGITKSGSLLEICTRLAQSGLGTVAKPVVGADDVRQKNPVEGAMLQKLGQFGPIGKFVETVTVVVGQHPLTVDDVADAVHLEEIDEKLFFGSAHEKG